MLDPTKNISQFLADVFRKDANKILAILIKLYGPNNMMWAEDTLQDTFSKAMQHWQDSGLPENPTAWLILTAKRSAIDKLRNLKLRQAHLQTQALAPELSSEWTFKATVDKHFEKSDFADEELRLLFWVASTDMPERYQLPLMLKTLCGLSLEAICRALHDNGETVKKQLQRGRKKLAGQPFELPPESDAAKALDKVHLALYLLFNEGISPRNPNPDKHIDLCVEAIGLTRLLIESESLSNQETLALFALMHFHYARLPARRKGGALITPLDEQDRSKWHSRHLVKAVQLLSSALASKPHQHPRYLLEALIAHEHCRAKTFASTDWQTIVQHYDTLYELDGSPLMALNRAVALAHLGKVDKAISQIENLNLDRSLVNGYQKSATLAYLCILNGDAVSASGFLAQSEARGLIQSEADVLTQRINRINVRNEK